MSDSELDERRDRDADRGYTSDSDFNYENVQDGKSGGKNSSVRLRTAVMTVFDCICASESSLQIFDRFSHLHQARR